MNKPISIAELLAKSKPKQVQTDADRILHGTGVTARAIERSESKNETQAVKAAKIAPTIIIQKVEVQPVEVGAMADTRTGAVALDEDQQNAVDSIQLQQFACLIGAAGTGKTTTSKAIIAQLIKSLPTIDLNDARRENRKVAYPVMAPAICIVAFTGRAVQQIKRAIPEEYHPMCRTVHATLGYAPVVETQYDAESHSYVEKKVFRPSFDSGNQLPFKLCVIDESGMLPIPLWNELLAALPDDCRFLLMGDINQLPPVQGRSVLGFAMTKWPTFALTKLHRNAGVIAQNAHKILEGRNPMRDKEAFAMVEVNGGGFDTLNQVQCIVQTLHKNGTFDPMTDALIVPQNKGTIGQEMLNNKLVHYFNPERQIDGIPVNKRTTIRAGRHTFHFAIGDKVMIKANDEERGITNGMCGVITNIQINPLYKGEAAANAALNDLADFSFDDVDLPDETSSADEEENAAKEEALRQASHIVTVQFQNVDEPVTFQTSGEYKDFGHAYAFTCHKSQGGEYPTVVIVCHSANSVMLTREWLYTAVTRAQKRVILIYNARGLYQAVSRQAIKGNTIMEKAASFLALQDNKDTTVPNLPKPKTIEVQ